MSDNPADPAQAQAQFGAALKARQTEFAQTFSQIVSLMMRDPKFRGLRLADLEWLVLPPILAGQWQVAQGVQPAPEGAAGGKLQGNISYPVATALWARVSPEVDARLSADVDKPLTLKAADWTSGDILWMIAIVGDPMYLKNFLTQMQANVFKGRTVKIRGATPEGKPALRTLEDLLKQAPAAT